MRGLGGGRFGDLEKGRSEALEAGGEAGVQIESRVLPEEEEDVREFKFGKFAATYFQGNATAAYIRRPLRYPLLPHEVGPFFFDVAADGGKEAGCRARGTRSRRWRCG